jgi:hypothetical protein
MNVNVMSGGIDEGQTNGLVVKERDYCSVAQVEEWLSGAVASSFRQASTLDIGWRKSIASADSGVAIRHAMLEFQV